jgi:hypothetical protein
MCPESRRSGEEKSKSGSWKDFFLPSFGLHWVGGRAESNVALQPAQYLLSSLNSSVSLVQTTWFLEREKKTTQSANLGGPNSQI